MSDSDDHGALATRPSALERAEAISRALNDAARRVRFSSRARSAYRGGSFEARRGTKFLRITALALLVLIVAIPDLVVSIYFGLIASDQYVSEARFTVGSGIIPKMDGLGSVTGVPPVLIIQDIQVVVNYIQSRPMVEKLEQSVRLRDIYSASEIDWWARFGKDKPIEKFVKYWDGMTSASIGMPSGIVTLQVRAFTPEDAKRIAEAAVKQSENLINDLNERMRGDTVEAAERDMQRASQELAQARIRMQYIRNQEGVLDVSQTSNALTDLASGLQAQLLEAQDEYQTELRYVSADAPQMRVLKTRIAALQGQLNDIKGQLTAQSEKTIAADADQPLSGKMTKFAELGLEEQIATQRYALAVASVEAARMLSERRMLYLHEIVRPALPQESEYPKRWLDIGITFIATPLIWGALVAGMAFVRNHMA